MKNRLAVAAFAAGTLAASLVAGAAAPAASGQPTTSDYPPSTVARTFATSTGGWTSQTESAGVVCSSGTTCPSVANSFQASGGANGDGYIRTAISGLTGVASDVSGTWTSPSFTYGGAGGKDPTSLKLSFDRKLSNADLADANLGNQVVYTASLIDTATGNVVAQPVDGRSATAASRWTAVGPVEIDPSVLKLGRAYRLEISTEFRTGTRVEPGGYVGYDDVDLNAKLGSGGSSGGGGSGGGSGGGGNGGKPVYLNWHRLIVKSRCPRSMHSHTCLIHLVSYAHRWGGAHPTRQKTVRRRGHHAKRISLRVRPKYNHWARNLANHHRRLHVRQKVKAHGRGRTAKTKLRVVAFKKP